MTTTAAAGALDELFEFDAEREADRICDWLREAVQRTLGRRGAVVGVSGGIDSSVTVALCARAFGSERVLALLTPEADSAPDTRRLSLLAAEASDIETLEEDVTATLEAVGCYARRDAAVARVVPEYTPEWKIKIVLPPVDSTRLRLFTLVAQSPDGERVERRLDAETYRALVAAMNLKQRVRKIVEYHHAERLGYVVAGTPNRLEYDQGFFVKGGDGAADVKPIAHLYKTQVYRLAEALGVPEEIRSRPPTTDTYSLPQTQEEFFFSLPYDKLDVCLFARNRGVPAEEAARAVGLEPAAVERVFADIDAKRRAARYLHAPPLLVEPV